MVLLSAGCSEERASDPAPEPEVVEEQVEVEAERPAFDGLEGFWDAERAEAILERTREFEVEADTSTLNEGERRAVGRLMRVGEIFHRLYEESRHAQATAVATHLAQLEVPGGETARLDALRRLYRLFEGPVAFTLEGERVPFAPVRPYEPGRNVYPEGTEAAALKAWLEAHPDAAPSVRATRTVVRRRVDETVAADRARLERHPWVTALHPGVEETLDGGDEYYAVPYSLAYADELAESSRLLFAAADDVREGDADLADYFEARARDLLGNDYEAGDAAWVSGRFARLNAEVGAYETYDDHLLGQKAFHAVSILVRAPEASAELERAVASLSDFEAALPGGPYERVRGEIPIGIYDVLADYGQARGGNTASILPNEAHITRKYGRTILIRRNVITHPVFVEAAQARFRAAVDEAHADDLGPRGAFDRTVWHEVGHYLGPKTTEDGRVVTEALGNLHNHIEEMKADLVSLWGDRCRAHAPRLRGRRAASAGHERAAAQQPLPDDAAHAAALAPRPRRPRVRPRVRPAPHRLRALPGGGHRDARGGAAHPAERRPGRGRGLRGSLGGVGRRGAGPARARARRGEPPLLAPLLRGARTR